MALPPRTDGANSLRANLRRAQALLKEAGWTWRDGALRNAQGEALTVELLDSTESRSVTTLASWQRALEKLGIALKIRSVDFALYQERLDSFSFEMVGISFPGTHFPGSEYADLFGSKGADTPGSGNLAGIRNPAVDALVGHIASGRQSGRVSVGLPCAGSCHGPRALHGAGVDEQGNPHRLQRLDARSPGHGASVPAGGGPVHGLAHDRLVGTHAPHHRQIARAA